MPWALLLCLGLTLTAHGQVRRATPGSLAAYAPPDCGLFLQLERPENIDPALRDVNAWKLFQILVGGETEDAGATTDWYDVLIANLAGESTASMRELLSRRAALVASDWSRLDQGVLLIQVPGRAALRPLIGPGLVRDERVESGLTVYETARGLRVATDGRTVVLSQVRASDELFSRCLELLRGGTSDSLLGAERFSSKVAKLPMLLPQGLLYFSNQSAAIAASPITTAPAVVPDAPTFLPRLREGVVGMYVPVRGDRVDFILRAASAEPGLGARPRLPLDRVKRLPRSTLVAWAMSVDVSAVLERLISSPPDSLIRAGVGLAISYVDPELLVRDVAAKLGPRVMLVLGHDFLTENGGSSLGLLIESTDAVAVKRALDGAVERAVDAVNEIAAIAEPEDGLRISSEDIFGVDVTVIELAEYATGDKPDRVGWRLASGMRPCYAVLDEWLVVAWDVEHIRELIAAQRGTRPTLGEFDDVSRVRPGEPVVLGVGRLAAAAAVLGEWLDRAEADPNSVLNAYVRGAGGVRGRALGLGLTAANRSGRAVVARAYHDGPCHGLVQPGDHILAVDGIVLDLNNPNGALRQRMSELTETRTVTLRIERGGDMLDVAVRVDRPANPREQLAADAVRALRRIQAVCGHLSFATVIATPVEDESYYAHVRLRFSESH